MQMRMNLEGWYPYNLQRKMTKCKKQAVKLYTDLIGVDEEMQTRWYESSFKILCMNIKSIRRPLIRHTHRKNSKKGYLYNSLHWRNLLIELRPNMNKRIQDVQGQQRIEVQSCRILLRKTFEVNIKKDCAGRFVK